MIRQQTRNYLSHSGAREQNCLIVQLQTLPEAFIAVFEAMSEENRWDDVTHCVRYGVVRIEWSSCKFKSSEAKGENELLSCLRCDLFCALLLRRGIQIVPPCSGQLQLSWDDKSLLCFYSCFFIRKHRTNLRNPLTLFIFESITEEVVLHCDVIFQCPLTLSEVTQVNVCKLPLLLPQVTVAQSYACRNPWKQKQIEIDLHTSKGSQPWVHSPSDSPIPLKTTWKRGMTGRSTKLSSCWTRASLTVLYPAMNTILSLPRLRLNTGPYSWASCS